MARSMPDGPVGAWVAATDGRPAARTVVCGYGWAMSPATAIRPARPADVAAIVCTADGEAASEVEKAEASAGVKLRKILVGGKRKGWHDFDA